MFDWRTEAQRLGVEVELEGLVMTVLARLESIPLAERGEFLQTISQVVVRSGEVQ